MRLFVALEIPSGVRDALWCGVDPLREAFPRLRWVPPQDLHLTLRFLGECRSDEREAVADAMSRLAPALRSLRVRWDGVGGFPSLDRAKVLWVGVEHPEPVNALAAAVRHELASVGASDDRAFQPHVTVARSSRRIRVLDRPARVDLDQEPFTMTEVSLVQSVLGPDGPAYERLQRWRLGG